MQNLPGVLRGIDAKAGHFGQAVHCIVVVREQLRHLLIELGKLVFEEAEFVERQLHQPPIDWMKIRAHSEASRN